MKNILLTLVFIAISCAAIYVVFFTSIIDRLFVRLTFKNTTNEVAKLAYRLQNAAEKSSASLRSTRNKADKALQDLDEIQVPVISKRKRIAITTKTKTDETN